MTKLGTVESGPGSALKIDGLAANEPAGAVGADVCAGAGGWTCWTGAGAVCEGAA